MVEYPMSITDAQDVILHKIAGSVGKTPQEVMDEQVAANIKRMILTAYPEFIPDADGLDDVKAAELSALLAVTKENYLKK